jgi:hypothetical protein
MALRVRITKVGTRYRVAATGKLLKTSGRTCGGSVLIDVNVKRVRAIARKAKAKANCTFTKTFVFSRSRIRTRLRESSRQHFRVIARYNGTTVLGAVRKTIAVRANR